MIAKLLEFVGRDCPLIFVPRSCQVPLFADLCLQYFLQNPILICPFYDTGDILILRDALLVG